MLLPYLIEIQHTTTMKKTLIFAAILAGVTSAAENEWKLDLVSTLPSSPSTVDGLTYSAWTAVYKDTAASAAKTLNFKDTSKTNWDEFSQNELLPDYVLGDNNKTIIFTFFITNDSAELVTLNSFNVVAFAANNNGHEQGGARYEALTLTFGDNALQTISTTLEIREKKEIAFDFSQPVELAPGQQVAVNLQLHKTSGNQFYPGFSSVSVKGVPEPATATLSLLALSGLVARRRRH